MEWFSAFIVVFASGMRLAVPLILACFAGLWSERSGIVDIGLEGKILVGAFASAAAATFTGSVWLGLLAGVAAAVVFSLIHGYASIDQRANQIVSGTAINRAAERRNSRRRRNSARSIGRSSTRSALCRSSVQSISTSFRATTS